MADYCAYIANCPIIGECTSTIDGTKYLNIIKLHLGQFDLKIVEEPQVVTKNLGEFRGHSKHTTKLLIENIAEDQLKNAEELAGEVASLLSLATCSMVTKFGYEFHNGKPIQSINPIFGKLLYFRPLIDTKDGSLIRKYLELTWPAYRHLKDSRLLNIAFNYFVWSQLNEEPIQLSLVITFVLFENLKHTYAMQQGYPFIKGFFREHGATLSKPGKSKSFQELLKEMFEAVGMTPKLDSIKKLRNDLIHSGVSNLNLREYIDIYSECHDILREYLLKLLKYTGTYFPYSSPNKPAVI